MRYLKHAALGLLFGFIAGVVVTGIGGRIVMRLIAIVDPNTQPMFTGGTLFLVLVFAVATGAIFGAPLGLLFVAIRRWLPGKRLWKGFMFGLILLVASGGYFFSLDHEEDFFQFDPPLFGISLFAVLYLVYGLMIGALTDRFVPSAPARPPSRQAQITTYVILTLVGIFGLIQNIRAIGAILRRSG